MSALIFITGLSVKEFQEKIETAFKIKIKNLDLFKTAFTHRSAVNEYKGISEHNERLEFLGDAVLELLVTEYLYSKFPDSPEGTLTNLRSSLVKGVTLAEVSRDLDLGSLLRVSKGEAIFGGREKESLLANTVESLLGAMYLDSGIEGPKYFVMNYLVKKLDAIIEGGDFIDAKSQFQQIAQAEFQVTPRYQEISSEGPDHEKTFEMAVLVGDKIYGTGTGNSKQLGQQAAARDALDKMGVKWRMLD